MSTISMLINGRRVQARNGAPFERHNPLDGSIATSAPAASVEDASDAVDVAAKAFPTWAAMGPGERRALLMQAAQALEARADAFAAAVAAGTGGSGKAGIAEFTDLRWMTVQPGPRHYPF